MRLEKLVELDSRDPESHFKVFNFILMVMESLQMDLSLSHNNSCKINNNSKKNFE